MAAQKISVHCVEIPDEPGSLHKLLESAASKGVDFQCFIACGRCDGKGLVFVSGKDPEKCKACAEEAGIEAKEMVGFVIEGEDKVGAAAEALKGLADAGINGAAGAAMVCEGQYHMCIIVESSDADAAEEALG